MTSIIAFAPAFNTHGRHDATGAFQPEARAFLGHNGAVGDLFLISNRNTEDAMRKQVLGAIGGLGRTLGADSAVAFFCHGLRRKIQFGFDVRNVDQLAHGIAEATYPGMRCALVVLYCCNTAGVPGVGGDGGFADALRDALCRAGSTYCQVDAHTTAGHTTRNPYVRRFEGKGSPVGGVGGYMLVAPKSKLWPKWRKAMQDEHGTLRYEFPFMAVSEIHKRLLDGGPR